MLRQRKISITFGQPVLGKDLQDGSEFLSNKHWVIAEVLMVDYKLARFFDFESTLVAEFPLADIEGIRIPVLDADSPVVKEQKSYDYLAVVKNQRPAAWSKWTPDEEQQLLANLDKGLSIEEIADIHQRTPVAIDARLERLGVYLKNSPKLGSRPEKRHYEPLGDWKGDLNSDGSPKTVCLGCGYEIHSRPCKCWLSNDTSHLVTWREHRNIYSMYGSVIGKRY
ncbi:hypothetical protein MCEMZLE2_01412 [Candidatus Nanopelagicaceae bacterium]